PAGCAAGALSLETAWSDLCVQAFKFERATVLRPSVAQVARRCPANLDPLARRGANSLIIITLHPRPSRERDCERCINRPSEHYCRRGGARLCPIGAAIACPSLSCAGARR